MKKIHWIRISMGLLIFLVISAFMPPKMDGQKSIEDIDFGGCHIDNTAFQPGEEITYKLYYNWNFIWIPAGEVVFKVKDFNKQYHLSVVGKTYSSYEWFFKVRDYYDTYIDKETLLPTLSIRDVTEGGYTLYDKVNFDQKKKKAKGVRGRTKETIKENNSFDLEGCTHDILSIIYHARNIDYDKYEAGKKFPIKVFMDKKSWPLQVNYLGKEEQTKIKGLGQFKTIKFSPEVLSGFVFSNDTQMDVWVSDDENRVPLLIESPVSVGSVKAILKDYKGLKNSFSARID